MGAVFCCLCTHNVTGQVRCATAWLVAAVGRGHCMRLGRAGAKRGEEVKRRRRGKREETREETRRNSCKVGARGERHGMEGRGGGCAGAKRMLPRVLGWVGCVR